ncbi:hypothetical protein AUR04nite_25360 [Glutamicibacter uratoxydans]|uniref:Mycothiol-dependent maleylpyruvate isomerase metal-binding domain-containing protein n=1 Tax=Glutamicibacter uratoxydans TaxID=43667 RepID=A0A4Y4DSY1_GLUUR|nr:maleylpyruvate isomerase family mycothiol-dependent enzyme [Glutamicibacter uratoxydans]GED07004.1 hypothetical protein AUR04nite_25360 [Glutamicibacter uratoxydans]
MDKAQAQHIWALVHAERKALIADLSTLDDEAWARDSAAAGWSVHDVAAHLVDNALTKPGRLLWAMLRAGFDFDKQNANGVAAQRQAQPAATLERLVAAADARTGPPAPLASRLVEEIAHGEDIRRALGIRREYPVPALDLAIGYQARTPRAVGGAKELAQRVQLVSDDHQRAEQQLRLGLGAVLAGPRLELLMALTGRTPAPGSLHGPGIAFLAPLA